MPGPNHVLIFHNFIQVSTDKHLGGGSLERIDLCNDRLNLFSWFLFFKTHVDQNDPHPSLANHFLFGEFV